MSGHLIGCVKKVQQLPTSHKLALVAFADSADDRTHIGFPGYEGVQEWAGVSRGRAAELIRDLTTWGYLRQHKRGHRGQRAEYVVFPDGCCDVHRTPAAEPPVDLEQLAAAAGVTVDQARQMVAVMGGTPLDPDEGSSTEKGSDALDAMSGHGSDAPDPITDPSPEPVDNTPSGDGKGPERVHGSRSNADAFTPSSTSPLPPPASRQGGRCPAHPDGHSNCRGCGTTPRQRAAAEKRAADEARRAAAKAKRRQERATGRITPAPAKRQEALAALRATVAPAPRTAQEASR